MSYTNNASNAVLDPVEKATTVVPTRTLRQQGIENIRVVSQSMFVDLVRDMVEESLDGRAPGSGSQANAALDNQWKALRKRHADKLARIESGMKRLSATFDSIRSVLETQQVVAPAQGPGAATEAEERLAALCRASAPTPPPAPSQKDLLREMLL